jgi:hypothetical protein
MNSAVLSHKTSKSFHVNQQQQNDLGLFLPVFTFSEKFSIPT